MGFLGSLVLGPLVLGSLVQRAASDINVPFERGDSFCSLVSRDGTPTHAEPHVKSAPPWPMHAKAESPQSMHRASDLHLLNLSESCDQAIPNKPCLLDLRPSMLHPAKVIGCFDLRPRMLLGPQTLHATSSQSHWMYVTCCRNPILLERQRERESDREGEGERERE